MRWIRMRGGAALAALAALSAGALAAASAVPEGTPSAGPGAAAPAVQAPQANLAARYGADANGMRRYVLVVLKTGPTRVPDGEARKAMFAGHFANMDRLAKAGTLAVAGPFLPSDTGWRGLFIFAVDSVEEAKALAETDPVIVSGEMVAEYHPWYGSAALMATAELHEQLVAPAPPVEGPQSPAGGSAATAAPSGTSMRGGEANGRMP
jgi:uncharacterized protein YciI